MTKAESSAVHERYTKAQFDFFMMERNKPDNETAAWRDLRARCKKELKEARREYWRTQAVKRG